MKTQLRFLLTALLVFSAICLFAQQGNRNELSIEDRIDKIMELIEKKIEINDPQKLVVKDAFTEFFKSAYKEKESGNRPDQSIMEGFEKERDQKIKQVLSEDQYESYLKISCKLRPKQQGQGQGQRPPKRN